MALDNLQNLPNTTQPTAFGVFGQTISVLLGITIFTCWIATQVAAYKLGFQDALGEPLAKFQNFSIYTPIDYFIWLLKFGNIEGTEEAFFYGEVILFSLHFLFVPAVWLAVRRAKKIGGKTDVHGSARWAIKEDIYTSTLLKRPPALAKRVFHKLIDVDKLPKPLAFLKLIFGEKPNKNLGCYIGAWIDPETGQYHYLTHDGPEHLLTFAPTRSGKGVGQVIPTLLSWPHSTVVHDIKGEAWALTSGFRKAKGHKVLKFEPSEGDGSSVRFNPLEEVRLRTPREVADVQNIAQMIVDPDGKGMADHWAKTGHELLSAAILHILYLGHTKTLRGLVSFFCDPNRTMEQVAESMLRGEHDPQGVQGWIDLNTGEPTKTHPVVAESARSFMNKSENERSGVQSTAMSYLSLYRDPIVAANTEVSEFKIHDLMNFDDPVSLYLVVPPNDKARLRPLIRLVLNQIFRQTTEKMDFADGRSVAGYKHRLLMMLDEFPALGKLELVQESLAFVAGYGIKCYLITQDLTQLYEAYGKNESILSNCHVRMAYAPNKVETAELLSKYCGVTTINKQTRSYSGSRLNPLLMHVMAAEQETQRPLLTPDECLRLPGAVKSSDGKNILEPGDMLIFPAGSSPIYGKQILYFKDPLFDARSKINPPTQSDRLHIRKTQSVKRFSDSATAPITVRNDPVVDSKSEIKENANIVALPTVAVQSTELTDEEIAILNAEADDEENAIFVEDDDENLELPQSEIPSSDPKKLSELDNL
jgi:type IV secretion system protein VirD4